jgi:hypothetical protein
MITIFFDGTFTDGRRAIGGCAGRGGCGRMGAWTAVHLTTSGRNSATSSRDRGKGRGGSQ